MTIILVGLALIAAAAFGIFTGYTNDDWVIASGSWAVLIIGALVTLFGFGKRVSNSLEGDMGDEASHAQIEIKALVQAMGSVAMADEKLRDQEIETIARIHENMLGIRITKPEVKEILSELGADFDIVRRLSENRSQISPAMKRILVQSCHLVMISDLEIDKTEESRVREIGTALGFDAVEVDDLIASAGV